MKTNVIIDSAAFQAWRLGKVIDIDQYSDYLIRNKNNYSIAINLDKIPGSFGKVPSASEVEDSATKSWENLKYLESLGHSPMPVFHQGEDFHWLETIMANGYDYVCISPDNGKGTKQKQDWLDIVFTMLTTKEGRPVVKTHGLGVTSVDLMLRYPWYSVDSATWIVVGAYGGTFVPKMDAYGKFNYRTAPYVVHLTKKSQKNLVSGMHLDGFAASVRTRILEFFEEEKIDYQELVDDCCKRSLLCLRVMKNISKELIVPEFKFRSKGLLASSKWFGDWRDPVDIPFVNVFYALSCAAIYSDALTVEGLGNRLFTYGILKDKDDDFLDFYARTGVFPKGKCRKRWVDADQFL